MKLHKPSQHDERDESGLKVVLVDLPDSLKMAAQIEAKRVGQSLEQWIAHVIATALAESVNGDEARG